jgi:hypothetical protein
VNWMDSQVIRKVPKGILKHKRWTVIMDGSAIVKGSEDEGFGSCDGVSA